MLRIGTKLGPYEIVGAIGAGGMGEVYRARDTRLARDVALKVLPEAFATDPERMARFGREAKVLASLNHPNIASIYGLEESNGLRALVMELAEGLTLADRVSRGPMPLDEALPIAKQICEGLEYAHERGIVHRDLKPANIKITPDGVVKLLDFGLAKALEGDAATSDPSTSPTLSHLATQAGMILGTAAYMAPEQAKGKGVDRRADIWAFGCVLYEMLTGKPTFSGETVGDVLAAVIKEQPEWSALPGETPRRTRDLLHRCLTKDARQRLRDIGEARIVIDQTSAPGQEESVGQAHGQPVGPWRQIAPWGVCAALLIISAVLALEYVERTSRPMPVYVSELSPPANAGYTLVGYNGGPPAVSPDGSRLAFCANDADGRHLLWVRPLGSGTAQPLEGTDGASFPFWSPDGRSLGFFAHDKLNRIDASGGPPLAIADAPNGRGGSWGHDGTILFAPELAEAIYRISASGGTPQPVTKIDASLKQIQHWWPQFLPDGRHFLFLAHSSTEGLSGIYAASLDGGEPQRILSGNDNAMYAAPGYLLFIRQGVLMMQRFDASRLALVGDASPLEEDAAVDQTVNRGIFGVSETGVLVYQSGGVTGGSSQLLWFDRSGKRIGETGSPGEYATVAISPDGNRLALGVLRPSSVWAFDLSRGTATRVTFSSVNNGQPAWSPDGRFIAFFSDRSGQIHIYQKAADGTGTTAPLVMDAASERYPSWSPDGSHLIFERQEARPGSHFEIWTMPLFGERKAFPVVKAGLEATWPSISPDGRWLAYVSAETGREEVYVVPFLHGTGKWLVSTSGGTRPRWRRDGREMFYLSLDNKIMAADINGQGPSFAVGRVHSLFQAVPALTTGWLYDVSSDGKKFVVVSRAAGGSDQRLTLVVNWPALLKKQ
ncbi:MAG: protein kinase [Acidobacteriota bacterium]|nr:protein kinase [Acidobacteriota bacterium]